MLCYKCLLHVLIMILNGKCVRKLNNLFLFFRNWESTCIWSWFTHWAYQKRWNRGFLPVFLILYCFPVWGIKEFTLYCTPYAKCGVVIPESSFERNLPYGSPVLTSGQVKNQYRCAWLVFPWGVKLLFQCTKLKMKFCNLCYQLPL